MLDPQWINENLPPLQVMTQDFHTATLVSISKHTADAVRAQGELMPSTVKQIESAQAAGLLYEDIEKHVAAYLHIAIPEVRALFKQAAVESIAYDSAIYEEAGQEPLKLSPAMQRIIQTRADTFTATLKRLTGTIATNSQEMFERTLNTAYNKVVAGTHSYTEALGDASDEMMREGIRTFDYAGGRNISTEAAILTNIRTSIGQTAGEITMRGMIERGVSYVDTSAHINARNTGEGFKNHQLWQGLQYYYSQIATEPNMHNLPDFVESTGYGDVAGMKGANCAHDFGPFYPGISTPRHSLKELQEYKDVRYTYTDARGNKRTVDAAAARDHQRDLERRVRAIKTRLAVEEAKGDLARPEVIIKLRRDRAAANKRIDKFCSETGLERQHFRERIAQKG